MICNVFVIYINDLPDKILNVTDLFAYEISVIRRQTWIEKIQKKKIDTMGDWCKIWWMRFNVEKC